MTSFTSQLLRLNRDQAPARKHVRGPATKPIRLVIELRVVGRKPSLRKP